MRSDDLLSKTCTPCRGGVPPLTIAEAEVYLAKAPGWTLEDDGRRCDWFAKRFKGDHLDIACEVEEAKELLKTWNYDSIFLDHDLMPEHYGATETDDERTGYAIAFFLARHPDFVTPNVKQDAVEYLFACQFDFDEVFVSHGQFWRKRHK